MSRVLAVALVTTALLVPALPTGATAETSVPACPEDLPITEVGPHAVAAACLDHWGLLPYGLPMQDPISRCAAARALTDLVVRAGTSLHLPDDDPFGDDDGHPDEAALSELATLGILNGTSGGAIAPERALTRGQLAALAVRTVEVLGGAPLETGPTPFLDIATSVHRDEIARAHTAGLMAGRTPDGFAPNAAATHGQYATVATRVLGALVTRGVIDRPTSPDTDFALSVVPTSVADSIGGQQIVLLVSLLRDDAPTDGPVTVSVTAEGAAVPEVAALLTPGGVAELSVIPEAVAVADPMYPSEARLAAVVSGVREGARHRVAVPIRVVPGEDDRRATAEEHLDRWTAWLASAHPELGIDPATEWTPVPVQPTIWVVSHYLFFSEDWELGLTWHVMIAPYDWSRIYLRPRAELVPTLAFDWPSVSDPDAVPVAIDPPPAVDR